MGKDTRYREKRYHCGEYMDVYVFPVYPMAPRYQTGRRKKRKPTREAQKRLNQKHAEKKLARLLHANFTERDLSLTLTFRDDPESDEAAKRELQNYLRRIRRIYRREGLELKYIWQMEKTKRGRCHFHLVLTGGVDRDTLEKAWKLGYANSRRLQFEDDGLSALAKYITKTHRGAEEERCTYRSYNGSRNLVDPEPEVSDSRIRSRKRAAELADEEGQAWAELYPGFELVEIEPYFYEETGGVYLWARLRRREKKGVESDGPKIKTQKGKTNPAKDRPEEGRTAQNPRR